MLLIISENLQGQFEKEKSSISPKSFSKNNISHNRQQYDNSTSFYCDYYMNRIDLLVDTIRKCK